MSNPLAFQFPFDASGALYTSERDGDSWRVSNAFWEPVDSQLKAHKHHTHGHLGEDWSPETGPINAPLYAVADGKVVYAQFHPQFGLTVIIEHDVSGNEGLNNVQTVYSLYAHLEAIDTDVVVNATVDAGDPIGILGGTGKGAVGEDGNSHPHLHLEIFSGNWQTYINGGSGLYGYAEYGPTPPIGWYEPSEFIISLATCTVKQSTIPGISRPIRR